MDHSILTFGRNCGPRASPCRRNLHEKELIISLQELAEGDSLILSCARPWPLTHLARPACLPIIPNLS